VELIRVCSQIVRMFVVGRHRDSGPSRKPFVCQFSRCAKLDCGHLIGGPLPVRDDPLGCAGHRVVHHAQSYFICKFSAIQNGMVLTGSLTGRPGLHVSAFMFGCSVNWQASALPPSLVSLSFVLSCGTQLVSCTTLVLAYPSVQYDRGILSTRLSGPLMDTENLLDWPKLDVPVDRDDPAGAGDEQRFCDSPVDYVLRIARRHTLRHHRVAVEAAILVNRAAAERQRRAVAADALSGRTPPVFATLDVAHLVSSGAIRGTDATPLDRENGV